MELSEEYRNKLKSFKRALDGFAKSMQVNLFSLTEEMTDLVKNAQVQKFEITSEVMWKTCMLYVQELYGIEVGTPKAVYRGMFQSKIIDDLTCENLIQLVNDRNSLSHIYNEKDFELVHAKLPNHLSLIQEVINKITS